MPRFYTQEYKDLVQAQRSISDEIANPGEKSNQAMLARALVDIIRLKRDVRGIPDPKPIDVSLKPRKRSSPKDYADSPVDPTAPKPS